MRDIPPRTLRQGGRLRRRGGAGRTIARFRLPSPSHRPAVTQAILSPELPAGAESARARITAAWLRDETEAVNDLLAQATLPPAEREQVIDVAAGLVTRVRARRSEERRVGKECRCGGTPWLGGQ